MSKKRPTSSLAGNDLGVGSQAIVLGLELARAELAEARRLAQGTRLKSPLPKQKYRFSGGEMDLLSPSVQPLDSKLAACCGRFAEAGGRERDAQRSAISMGEFYTLLEFARRAAVLAIREESTDWIVAGVTAVAMIEAARVDWRDMLVALGVLHHAAERVGLDADPLFRDMSRLAEPGAAALLEEFGNRSLREKQLSAWGFEEVVTPQGIGLIRGGFGRARPSYDLVAIAGEIADHLQSDVYRSSQRQPDFALQALARPPRGKIFFQR